MASGGFSIVYLAHDVREKPVAVKEYLPSGLALRSGSAIEPVISTEQKAAFDHGLRCFFEEGRHLAKLDHPSIVRVIDFLRANGTVYLVMEYERGRTLQEHIIKHRGALSEEFLRKTFADLLSGLREVHKNKLLHLDIKPANIYLRSEGSPLLLDFGAARQTIGHDLPQIRAMHTPGFAAPEQYDGDDKRLGPWTDIYAIGATMYSCLSGANPPAADKRLKDDSLKPARDLWRGTYSSHFLELIDSCLGLDPLARPQSVFGLQRELEIPQAVSTLPETLMKRIRRWIKR
jgi:serine/threonine protein kinase